VTESVDSSTSVLHKQWARLEDEHYELAMAIEAAQARGLTSRRCASGKQACC
jgi:hypothetical protein